MTPGEISERVVLGRLGIVADLLGRIRDLPLEDLDTFRGDPRNVGAAESFLRRSLEALLDAGRHILARGFGRAVSEYKEIALELGRAGVLTEEQVSLLRILAGYRNRLVHLYHDVSEEELFEICSRQLGDIEKIDGAIRAWLRGR